MKKGERERESQSPFSEKYREKGEREGVSKPFFENNMKKVRERARFGTKKVRERESQGPFSAKYHEKGERVCLLGPIDPPTLKVMAVVLMLRTTGRK